MSNLQEGRNWEGVVAILAADQEANINHRRRTMSEAVEWAFTTSRSPFTLDHLLLYRTPEEIGAFLDRATERWDGNRYLSGASQAARELANEEAEAARQAINNSFGPVGPGLHSLPIDADSLGTYFGGGGKASNLSQIQSAVNSME